MAGLRFAPSGRRMVPGAICDETVPIWVTRLQPRSRIAGPLSTPIRADRTARRACLLPEPPLGGGRSDRKRGASGVSAAAPPMPPIGALAIDLCRFALRLGARVRLKEPRDPLGVAGQLPRARLGVGSEGKAQIAR